MLWTRMCLVAVLAASLLYAPLQAAARPLGVVLYAERALLGGAAVATGSTVFPGDVVATDGQGALRLRLGSGQVYLLADSRAQLAGTAEKYRALVQRGTVGFAATAGQPIELASGEWLVRPRPDSSGPRGAQSTHAEMTLVGPEELIVTSYRGDVDVSAGEESFTVPAGNTYRLMLGQGPSGEGGDDARRRRLLAVWLLAAGIGAAAGIIIWRATISPDAPQ